MSVTTDLPPEAAAACTDCLEGSPCPKCKSRRTESEYQSAFRAWPWHPRLQTVKPGDNGDPLQHTTDSTRAKIAEKTTYRVDFDITAKKFLQKAKGSTSEMTVPVGDLRSTLYDMDAPRQKMKRMQRENAKVIHPCRDAAIRKDTNYILSFKGIDSKTMQACRQPAIRAKDNIEIPGTGDATGNTKSTAQDDYIVHLDKVRPMPIRPVDNTFRNTDPIMDKTEYKVNYYTKAPQRVVLRKPLSTVRTTDFTQDKFQAISTAMADFMPPKNPERPTACIPPVSDHFSKEKFDATTTFDSAYKSWPVQPYELPVWALKAQYKQPEGGMLKNSLYRHDFRDPEVIKPPTPIKPEARNKYLIVRPDAENIPLDNQTTYTTDFRVWEDGTARESYRVINVYTPPKEKMNCETNQRADYKGEKADRRSLCRKVSQHREMNSDKTMMFGTTYSANFGNLRPQTTPAYTNNAATSVNSRSTLAKIQRSMGPISTSSSNTPLLYQRPYVTPPSADGLKRHDVTPASEDGARPPQTADILTLHVCQTCQKYQENCSCP